MTPRSEVFPSIFLPTLNEARGIAFSLRALQAFRRRGCEAIVVDGGSTDPTTPLCRGKVDPLIEAARGRASQLNAGAALARGEALLFVHADTLLPANADALIHRALAGGADWGRFDVRIDGESRMLPLVAAMMNYRSRPTGVATGTRRYSCGKPCLPR